MQPKAYDIIVIGSGLVGATLLTALSRHGVKMAVIDKQKIDTSLISGKARAIALSENSLHFLKSINVWDSLAPSSTPMQEVHVSSQGLFGATRLKASEYGLKKLGNVVDADLLNATLNQALESIPSLDSFCPDFIEQCTKITEGWSLTLHSGTQITARLLVGADGTNSFLRKRMGIEVKAYNYSEQAIVTNVHLNRSHHYIAYERFTKEGAIAMLPFGENRVKCVVIAAELKIKQLLSLEDAEYLNYLQENFGFRLGKLKTIEERITYPLKRVCAKNIYGQGWVLIGNAANTLHPLAAQGFNLGLRDVADLVQILVEAKKLHQDIHDIQVLQRYAASRAQDHAQIQMFTHTLVKQKKLQHVGILAIEFIPMLKGKLLEFLKISS